MLVVNSAENMHILHEKAKRREQRDVLEKATTASCRGTKEVAKQEVAKGVKSIEKTRKEAIRRERKKKLKRKQELQLRNNLNDRVYTSFTAARFPRLLRVLTKDLDPKEEVRLQRTEFMDTSSSA